MSNTHDSSGARPPLAIALVATVLVVVSGACSSGTQEEESRSDEDNARVLVFTRTAAYRHASIEPGVEALRELASAAAVGLDHTEDPTVFSDTELVGYDAVVFLSTSGDVLDVQQQEALEGFVRAGGGFAGIHAAADTEYEWPWYGELVGAYFEWHPPALRSAVLVVAEEGHPATTGLPSRWIRDDEWYDFRDVQPGLSVLLEVDDATYKEPDEHPSPSLRPVAWYREFDGGRSFYTALGHTSESFDEPEFRSHIWGGITWVLGP